MRLYSIYDKAAQVFLAPMVFGADGAAIREFGDAVNDPKHRFGAHPRDYELYYLGDMSEKDGNIDPVSDNDGVVGPQLVIAGVQLVRNDSEGGLL